MYRKAFAGEHCGRRIAAFLACAAVFLAAVCSGAAGLAEEIECRYTVTYGQSDARAMLALINSFRTGDEAWYWNSDNETKTVLTDLEPLEYDYELEAEAMQRAAEIALHYSHTRPDGTSCFTVGMTYGENIAAGYSTYTAVFTGWQETDEPAEGQGHRRNMLNSSFKTVGIGHAVADGIHFWVQEFSPRKSGAPAAAAADGDAAANVRISTDIVEGISITGFPSGRPELEYETVTELPMAEAELERTNYWRRIYSMSVRPAWTSSDEDAVTVADGAATGHVVGATELTASVLGSKYTVTVNVVYRGLTADLILPADLTVIDQNAFEGTKASAADIPAGVTRIASGAFSQCKALKQVCIRGMNTEIADDAFPAGQAICFICPRGSSAEAWASARQYTVVRMKQ